MLVSEFHSGGGTSIELSNWQSKSYIYIYKVKAHQHSKSVISLCPSQILRERPSFLQKIVQNLGLAKTIFLLFSSLFVPPIYQYLFLLLHCQNIYAAGPSLTFYYFPAWHQLVYFMIGAHKRFLILSSSEPNKMHCIHLLRFLLLLTWLWRPWFGKVPRY
jgi:hypothetical protein